MRPTKTGIIAEFETGYLQREIRVIGIVTGGTDIGLRNGDAGFGTQRLVQAKDTPIADIASATIPGVDTTTWPAALTSVYVISAPATPATATSIGTATHIIAQSDDTIREDDEDRNYPERYTTLPNLVCKNATYPKTVALYKIVNPDDIKLINLGS
jgi:hypothetical protein